MFIKKIKSIKNIEKNSRGVKEDYNSSRLCVAVKKSSPTICDKLKLTLQIYAYQAEANFLFYKYRKFNRNIKYK